MLDAKGDDALRSVWESVLQGIGDKLVGDQATRDGLFQAQIDLVKHRLQHHFAVAARVALNEVGAQALQVLRES